MGDKKGALIRMAKESRDWCLKHEKYELFKEYAAAIGIVKVQEIEGWAEHQKRKKRQEKRRKKKSAKLLRPLSSKTKLPRSRRTTSNSLPRWASTRLVLESK